MNKLLDAPIKPETSLDVKQEALQAVNSLVENNVITYDKETNTIIFNSDIKFHFKGNVDFTSDRHIIMSSGGGFDPSINYRHAIWLNPEYNDDGKLYVDKRIPAKEIESTIDVKL